MKFSCVRFKKHVWTKVCVCTKRILQINWLTYDRSAQFCLNNLPIYHMISWWEALRLFGNSFQVIRFLYFKLLSVFVLIWTCHCKLSSIRNRFRNRHSSSPAGVWSGGMDYISNMQRNPAGKKGNVMSGAIRIQFMKNRFLWLARLVGNEGPSTFTLVYWGWNFPHSLLRAS